VRHLNVFDFNQVSWAALAQAAPHFGGRKNRSSQAQKAGLRYERKAQEYLQELFPDHYVASPWLVFRLVREPYMRWCQPDGILIEPERSFVTIIEIKLRHMPEAYAQINGIYLPVLRRLFAGSGFHFRQLEVVRWYDPSQQFPVPVQLVSTPALTPTGRFGVHIFN